MEAMFSPDGKRLVIGGPRNAVLCDATAPAVATARFSFSGDIACAAFSPDSQLVAIASQVSMRNRGEVGVWAVQTGKLLTQPLQEQATVNQVEFSNDGTTLLTSSFDKSSVSGGMTNGGYQLSDRSRVSVWRLPRNDPEMVQVGLTNGGKLNVGRMITNGATTITAENNQVRIQDASTGRLLATLEHKDIVRHVAISRDGKKLVTANDEGYPYKGEARIWDSRSGDPLSPVLPQDFKVGSVQFNSDGSRLLVACGDIFQRTGQARVWDAKTGKPVTPPMKLTAYLEFAAFSPDGHLVVTTGFKAARVWDARTGLPITPVLAHPDCFVSYAEFEPDSCHLLTTCVDPIKRRWNITPDSRPVARLIDLAQILSGQKLDSVGAPIHLRNVEFQQISERLHQAQ